MNWALCCRSIQTISRAPTRVKYSPVQPSRTHNVVPVHVDHRRYRGVVDDPRNTDCAWMETTAVLHHDDDGSATRQFKLQGSYSILQLMSVMISIRDAKS